MYTPYYYNKRPTVIRCIRCGMVFSTMRGRFLFTKKKRFIRCPKCGKGISQKKIKFISISKSAMLYISKHIDGFDATAFDELTESSRISLEKILNNEKNNNII